MSAELRWAKIGAAVGGLGVVAALLVFVLPQPLPFFRGDDPKDPPSPTVPSVRPGLPAVAPTTGPAPAGSSGAAIANARYLTGTEALPLLRGAGQVRAVGGRDLSMPCGTGQSDDRFRELEYALPSPYASFATQARITGRTDTDSRVGVQIYVRSRFDRADQERLVSTVLLRRGAASDVAADLTGATALVVRVTCSSNALAVAFAAPAVGT